MAVAVTIGSVTDPIDSTNQTTVVANGTTDTGTNTVSIKVVDVLGASVTASAVVTTTTWALAATDVSSLADGALIFEATATAVDTSKAFAAKAATKSTGAALYITDAIFREAITDSSNLNANKVSRAIHAASRRVDEICSRNFGLATSVSARPFTPLSWKKCTVDDIATTTGLIVQTDADGDGTYETTWTINTDFVVEPESGLRNGLTWSFDQITAVGTINVFPDAGRFPAFPRKKPVLVTAKWGWLAVPDAVVTATTLLAVRYYSRPDAPYGNQGFGDMGALPVRRDWDVEDLLSDYAATSSFLVA